MHFVRPTVATLMALSLASATVINRDGGAAPLARRAVLDKRCGGSTWCPTAFDPCQACAPPPVPVQNLPCHCEQSNWGGSYTKGFYSHTETYQSFSSYSEVHQFLESVTQYLTYIDSTLQSTTITQDELVATAQRLTLVWQQISQKVDQFTIQDRTQVIQVFQEIYQEVTQIVTIIQQHQGICNEQYQQSLTQVFQSWSQYQQTIQQGLQQHGINIDVDLNVAIQGLLSVIAKINVDVGVHLGSLLNVDLGVNLGLGINL